MKTIITVSGTMRPGSNTRKTTLIINDELEKTGVNVDYVAIKNKTARREVAV